MPITEMTVISHVAFLFVDTLPRFYGLWGKTPVSGLHDDWSKTRGKYKWCKTLLASVQCSVFSVQFVLCVVAINEALQIIACSACGGDRASIFLSTMDKVVYHVYVRVYGGLFWRRQGFNLCRPTKTAAFLPSWRTRVWTSFWFRQVCGPTWCLKKCSEKGGFPNIIIVHTSDMGGQRGAALKCRFICFYRGKGQF